MRYYDHRRLSRDDTLFGQILSYWPGQEKGGAAKDRPQALGVASRHADVLADKLSEAGDLPKLNRIDYLRDVLSHQL